MKVSIITPVWNKAQLTQDFLNRHWLLFRDRTDTEIIIIDNGSTDNTAQVLNQAKSRWGDRLQIVTNQENKGFPAANNQGAKIARGDILIFISNDVTTNGDYITIIATALGQAPKALVGAELLDLDTGWNKFNGRPIPYLTGWCVACTCKTFEALGGWDEQYTPCDYEDLDLSYTANQQGRKLIPLILPLHHMSGMSGTQLPDRYAMTERHRRLFAEKWGFNEPIAER